MKLRHFLSLFLSVLIVISGIGAIVNAQAATKPTDVQVTLGAPTAGEYKIESSETTFKPGVKYRFVVRNAGRKLHEFLVLPKGVDDERQALVAIEEDYLKPNNVAVRNLTFSKPGDYELSCRYSDHYEKGMLLPVTVQ